MPPFRTYLVLSIIFFLVAFFDPREEFGIFFDPEQETAGESDAPSPSAAEIQDEVTQDLLNHGVVSDDQVEELVPGIPELRRETVPAEIINPGEPGEEESGTFNIQIASGKVTATDKCDNPETSGLPEWAASRLTPERLTEVCKRVAADNGNAFLGKLLDNVPAALIALLPIMALILKSLYPLSKRYYVEHLLFVIHFHAFIFLILTLQILFVRLVSLLNLSETFSGITTFAVSLYIPVYLFLSMRRVYRQSRLVTVPKYLVLLGAYFIGLMAILLFTAFFAAFSI